MLSRYNPTYKSRTYPHPIETIINYLTDIKSLRSNPIIREINGYKTEVGKESNRRLPFQAINYSKQGSGSLQPVSLNILLSKRTSISSLFILSSNPSIPSSNSAHYPKTHHTQVPSKTKDHLTLQVNGKTFPGIFNYVTMNKASSKGTPISKND